MINEMQAEALKHFNEQFDEMNHRIENLESDTTLLVMKYNEMMQQLANSSSNIEGRLIDLKEMRTGREKIALEKRVCYDDPLEDTCEDGLEGFSAQALTIDSARMCDEKLTVLLPKNDEWDCVEDPTCRKCRKKQIDTTTQLFDAFNSQAAQESRKKRVEAAFPLHRNFIQPQLSTPIIICSVNYGQVYLLLNWACSCLENDVFDPRLHTYVVPTDEDAHNLLVHHGFIVEPIDWLKNSPHISTNYKGGANVGGHALINSILSFTVNSLVGMDYHALLMDVDMVFLHNPFPYLMKASRRRDVLGMLSPRNDQYGFMNSGFIFLRPTAKAKMLTQSFENLSFIKAKSDQQLWNTILRHMELAQLEQRILPRHIFFTLWKSAEKYGYSEEVTQVLHAVSVEKAPRLINLQQWHFTDKCPFFEKELEEIAKKNKLFGEFNP